MAQTVDFHAGQSEGQPRCMAELTGRHDDGVGAEFRQTESDESRTSRISASRMWGIAAHLCRRYL